MEDTISLYTITNAQQHAKRTAHLEYITEMPYDRVQAELLLTEAKKYVLLFVDYSYYEGEYDREEPRLVEIEPERVVVKDGALYGFIVHCTYDRGDYIDLLYVSATDTYAKVTVKSDSRNHGDTMSESGCYVRLLTRTSAEEQT